MFFNSTHPDFEIERKRIEDLRNEKQDYMNFMCGTTHDYEKKRKRAVLIEENLELPILEFNKLILEHQDSI